MKTNYGVLTTLLVLVTMMTTKAETTENPLLKTFENIHQTAPFDKIENEHFLPAFNVAIEETRAEVQAIINNPEAPTFENTVVAMSKSGDRLSTIRKIFFNLNSAETNDEVQKIAQEVAPMLSEFGNDISLNPDLFARVKVVYEQKDELGLNPEQETLLENSYLGFVRSGANLNADDKARYREITGDLSKLGLTFSENVLAETNAFELHITDENKLTGLPEFRRLHATDICQTTHFNTRFNTRLAPLRAELRRKCAPGTTPRCDCGYSVSGH